MNTLKGNTYYDGMVTIQFCELCGDYLGSNYPSDLCRLCMGTEVRFVVGTSINDLRPWESWK